MRAVVLAAGRGIRMGGAMPKTLIPVGDHEPLLFYLLKGLQATGIEDLMVVTGFQAQAVQDYVVKEWSGLTPTFVFNARYASWGNFHSMRVALDQSPGMEVLFLNSDIVLHPEVIRRVGETEGDLVLGVEAKPYLDIEDMQVRLDGDRVVGIGKDLDIKQSHGEFIGVSLVRPEAARHYLDLATELEWRAETAGYYEDVYGALLRHVDVRAAWGQTGEYAEVDEPDNVRDAARVIERHHEAFGITPVAKESA